MSKLVQVDKHKYVISESCLSIDRRSEKGTHRTNKAHCLAKYLNRHNVIYNEQSFFLLFQAFPQLKSNLSSRAFTHLMGYMREKTASLLTHSHTPIDRRLTIEFCSK